jgi:type II secretory pathway component PulF
MSGMLCVVAVLLLLSMAIGLLVVVPGFEATFAQYETTLPAITVMVLQAATTPMAAAVVVLAVLLVGKELALQRRHAAAALVVNLLAVVMAGVAAGIGVIALALPYVKLMESMG